MGSSATSIAPPGSSAPRRIVGIGASAGGLAALKQFLSQVPAESRMAYVVVQHLDPTQKALLPELLQRVTRMPVREATQGIPVEPDCVYVIPPNTELSVTGHRLKLAVPEEPRGLRSPVNVLFSSLAREEGERSIGVVLSGMGSDGTQGLQAIKAVGGLSVVQAPESAEFDSMPRSAINAGCTDIVAPPGELPARIMAYVAQLPVSPTVPVGLADVTESTSLQRVVDLLRARSRHDFQLHKPSTLLRRIDRRMAIHRIESLERYADFLERNLQELDLLFKELLIGVTSFFRDAAVWEYLARSALPVLLAGRNTGRDLRVWSVGCSTGEEAYSLAMIFSELIARLPRTNQLTLQIFASDLSPDAIAVARRGEYPLSIAADVSPARLSRFFTAHETHYQVNKTIRDKVLFAQHDVVFDPPFTKLDLIACRNLLIYLDPRLQHRLLPMFHHSLRSGGILLLGCSETVGRLGHLFTPVHSKHRIFVRQDSAATGDPGFTVRSFPPFSRSIKEDPMAPPRVPAQPEDSLQVAADRLLLQFFAPPAVIINGDADIVYISGSTGKYLEPAAGKANWNFFAMVREGMRGPLAAALQRAAAQSEPLQVHGLEVPTPGGAQFVTVTLRALQEPAVLRGMTMVVFRDLPPTPRRRRRVEGKNDPVTTAELEQYQTEIRALREEARTSREQLQATNEELQSTNEELQSANEELTASKEEMQSMNEELQTINAELQTRLDDLVLAQSDMKNLLNSVEIAILFLDRELNVRRFTDRVSRIISLRESDIGRPLSDLTSSLQYPELYDDALETLRTLKFSERQIRANDGRWFSVRIIPYRRIDNLIDGVVITLIDITAAKELESALLEK